MSEKKRFYEFHGYTVDVIEGEIKKPNGTVVNVLRNNGCPCVKIKVDGKMVRRSPGAIVYECVHGEAPKWGDKIIYKDGNDENFSISNIEIADRKIYGTKHTKVKQDRTNITEEDQKLISEIVNVKRKCVERWGVPAKRIHPNSDDLAILWDVSPAIIRQIADGVYQKG